MTCAEFEQRYQEIAEGEHDVSESQQYHKYTSRNTTQRNRNIEPKQRK